MEQNLSLLISQHVQPALGYYGTIVIVNIRELCAASFLIITLTILVACKVDCPTHLDRSDEFDRRVGRLDLSIEFVRMLHIGS